MRVEIYPTTQPKYVRIWIPGKGLLCEIPTEVAEEMGLPPYAGYVRGELKLVHIKEMDD